MQGSVYKGYSANPKIVPEYNVRISIKDSQLVFNSKWKEMIITPLDTCGTVVLTGKLYKKLYKSVFDAQDKDPIIKVLMEQYK